MLYILMSFHITHQERFSSEPHLPSIRKMEDATMGQYWCYICSRLVNPIREVHNKCPFCETEFVEEVRNHGSPTDNLDSRLNQALSQFAQLFLGLMEGLNLPPALVTTHEFESSNASQGEEETEQEREHEVGGFRSYRRRNSISVISFFHQHPQVTMTSDNNENDHSGRDGRIVIFDNNGEEVFVVRGSFDLIQTQHPNQNSVGNLGGLPVGQGFHVLLQRLLDNDPNRYGTLPTQKAAMKAMPGVIIDDRSQCVICLEDLEIGAEAKEMPCKHKYHTGCILSWLELHSSCPLCRFQMPTNEFKTETGETPSSSGRDQFFQFRAGAESERYGRRRYWLPLFWPFRNFFISSMFTTGASSTNMPSDRPVQEHASMYNLIEDN